MSTQGNVIGYSIPNVALIQVEDFCFCQYLYKRILTLTVVFYSFNQITLSRLPLVHELYLMRKVTSPNLVSYSERHVLFMIVFFQFCNFNILLFGSAKGSKRLVLMIFSHILLYIKEK